MRHLMITALMLLALPAVVAAADFRGAEWGMSKAEVQQTEDLPLVYNKEDTMIFEGDMGDRRAQVVYMFTDDKFWQGKYFFKEQHRDANRYIDDYDAIHELLVQEYGEPDEKEELWFSKPFEDDPSKAGIAISAGAHARYGKWRKPDMTVYHSITGFNSQIVHAIEYKPAPAKPAAEPAPAE
jgi:hypothetical protein